MGAYALGWLVGREGGKADALAPDEVAISSLPRLEANAEFGFENGWQSARVPRVPRVPMPISV